MVKQLLFHFAAVVSVVAVVAVVSVVPVVSQTT